MAAISNTASPDPLNISSRSRRASRYLVRSKRGQLPGLPEHGIRDTDLADVMHRAGHAQRAAVRRRPTKLAGYERAASAHPLDMLGGLLIAEASCSDQAVEHVFREVGLRLSASRDALGPPKRVAARATTIASSSPENGLVTKSSTPSARAADASRTAWPSKESWRSRARAASGGRSARWPCRRRGADRSRRGQTPAA